MVQSGRILMTISVVYITTHRLAIDEGVMQNDLGRAIRALDFLDGQSTLWNRHLPRAFGAGHWHIINFVRPHGPEGITLKKIFFHVAAIFGMDNSTCKKRLKDLFQQDLLTSADEPLRSSSQITATPKLIERYDAYAVELANLMLSIASEAAPVPIITGMGGDDLNERINRFFERLSKIGEASTGRFLRENIKNTVLRDKASACLNTYTYWTILSAAWRSSAEKGDYLVTDDFHVKIYPIVKKGVNSTKEALDDLIKWGFLERLNQSHGVKSNRYAVRITESAFQVLRSVFEQGHEVMVHLARDIAGRFTGGETAASTVVPITRARNVSGTSPTEDEAKSA